MQLSPGKLRAMRRLADTKGRFKMTAADQRPPIKNLIAKHYGVDEAPYEEVARFKQLLVTTLQHRSSAMLLDPHYAIPYSMDSLAVDKGLVVTLEDSCFIEGDGGERLSSAIDHWSVAKIKRMGADAVKVLVWYRPDTSEKNRQKQHDFVKKIGEQCARYDIPYLLEMLVYPLANDSYQTKDYEEMKDKQSDYVLASVAEFAKLDYLVDIFKLESPIAAPAMAKIDNDDTQVQALFDEMGRLAARPWVMLSAGADKDSFYKIMRYAYRAGASGYLAGRSIWWQAFTKFPDWQAINDGLLNEASAYMDKLNELTDAHAKPWYQHDVYGQAGAIFRPTNERFRFQYGELI